MFNFFKSKKTRSVNEFLKEFDDATKKRETFFIKMMTNLKKSKFKDIPYLEDDLKREYLKLSIQEDYNLKKSFIKFTEDDLTNLSDEDFKTKYKNTTKDQLKEDIKKNKEYIEEQVKRLTKTLYHHPGPLVIEEIRDLLDRNTYETDYYTKIAIDFLSKLYDNDTIFKKRVDTLGGKESAIYKSYINELEKSKGVEINWKQVLKDYDKIMIDQTFLDKLINCIPPVLRNKKTVGILAGSIIVLGVLYETGVFSGKSNTTTPTPMSKNTTTTTPTNNNINPDDILKIVDLISIKISGCYMVTNNGGTITATRLEDCSDWYNNIENQLYCSCFKNTDIKTIPTADDCKDEGCKSPYCLNQKQSSCPSLDTKPCSFDSQQLSLCNKESINEDGFVFYMYQYFPPEAVIATIGELSNEYNKSNIIPIIIGTVVIIIVIFAIIYLIMHSKKGKKGRKNK